MIKMKIRSRKIDIQRVNEYNVVTNAYINYNVVYLH